MEAEAEVVAVAVAEAEAVVAVAVVEAEAEGVEAVGAEEEIRHEKAPGSPASSAAPRRATWSRDSQPLCLRAAAAEHDRSAGLPGRMHNDPRWRPLSVRGGLGQLYGRLHRRLWGGLDHPSVRLECGTPEVPGA